MHRRPPVCEDQIMALKTNFFVQAFTPTRGQLKLGKRDLAPSENGAIRKAEAWAARKTVWRL